MIHPAAPARVAEPVAMASRQMHARFSDRHGRRMIEGMVASGAKACPGAWPSGRGRGEPDRPPDAARERFVRRRPVAGPVRGAGGLPMRSG